MVVVAMTEEERKVLPGIGDVISHIKGKIPRIEAELAVIAYQSFPDSRLEEEGFKERLSKIEQFFYGEKGELAPSSIILLGEVYLCLQRREKALQCLEMGKRQVQSSLSDIEIDDAMFMYSQLALFQSMIGLEPDALDAALHMLEGAPKRDPATTEALRMLAMTTADCMHISMENYAKKELMLNAIEKISSKQQRSDTYAVVARKLCNRNDTTPTSDVRLVELAESLLPRVDDEIEKISTLYMIGISRAWRGETENARRHFEDIRSLARSRRRSEQFENACKSTLFKAYAEAGLLEEAEEMAKQLRDDFRNFTRSSSTTMDVLDLFKRMPKEIERLADDIIELEEGYVEIILGSFTLAGCVRSMREGIKNGSCGNISSPMNAPCVDASPSDASRGFPSSSSYYPSQRMASGSSYLEEAKKMTARTPYGRARFNSYLELSVASAELGEVETSLELFQQAVRTLQNADRKTAKYLFEEITTTCAKGYFNSGDTRFLKELLQYSKTFGIRGDELSDACCELLNTVASMARDRRWQVTFYVNV